MKPLRIFALILCMVALTGCFRANFLAEMKPQLLADRPLKLTNVTANYIEKPAFEDIRDALAVGLLVPWGEQGGGYMAFVSGENPQLNSPPERFFMLSFYPLADYDYLMAYAQVIRDKETGKYNVGPYSGVAFMHQYGRKIVINPWADPDFLHRAIGGQIEAEIAPPSENPFASIAGEVIFAEPLKPDSDVKGGETQLANLEEARRISAAIRATNYGSNRTMFFEISIP